MVLDEDLQVVWTWDAFDHLDVDRAPILGETATARRAPCSARSTGSKRTR